MSKFTENRLGIVISATNEKTLVGKIFSDQEFDEISLGPVDRAGQIYQLVNCRFTNCTIGPGEFVVRSGVVLRNTVFENVFSNRCMTISANAILDHVTLRGKLKEGGLWVKPDEVFNEPREAELLNWVTAITGNIDIMLDISDYEAPEVTILGIPTSRIVLNPAKHVVMQKKWKNEIKWEDLGIGPTSFWRLGIRYLCGFGVEEGVFGLPLIGDDDHDQVMKEHGLLRSMGFLSSPCNV